MRVTHLLFTPPGTVLSLSLPLPLEAGATLGLRLPLPLENFRTPTKWSPTYGAEAQTLTVTLASLADGAARASAAVSNEISLYREILVQVRIKTGSSSLGGDKRVDIYAYGTVDKTTPVYPDTVTGSDATITLNNPTQLRFLGSIDVAATSTTYTSEPFSLYRALGSVPERWGIVVVNRSGSALDSTEGNFVKKWQGIYTPRKELLVPKLPEILRLSLKLPLEFKVQWLLRLPLPLEAIGAPAGALDDYFNIIVPVNAPMNDTFDVIQNPGSGSTTHTPLDDSFDVVTDLDGFDDTFDVLPGALVDARAADDMPWATVVTA